MIWRARLARKLLDNSPVPKSRWLADVKDGKWWFRQLFADDQRQPRARFPNAGTLLTVKEVSADLKTISFNEPLRGGAAGPDAELVVYQNFSVSRARIKSAGRKQVVTADAAGCAGPEPQIQARAGMAAHLEHARAFVDQPGEWHLDRATGVLSYRAADGANPNDRAFVAPACDRVLAIEGKANAPLLVEKNAIYDTSGSRFASTKSARRPRRFGTIPSA